MHDTNDWLDKRSPDLDKIGYLLHELDKWVGEGVLTRDTYNDLSRRYKAEQTEILRLGRVNKLLVEARSAQTQRRFADVINKAMEAIELDQGNIECTYLLASAYENLGQYAQALSAYESLVTLCPGDAASQNSVVRIREILEKQTLAQAREEERLRQQREQAEKMERLRQLKAPELASQANEALAQGRFTDALDAAVESIKYDPQNTETWALIARIYSAQEMWVQAEKAWIKAVHRNPNAEYQDELAKATAARTYQERSIWSKLWEKGSQAVEAFMEERNVQWVHLLGAAILLSGLIGVSAWVVTVQKLWGIVGRALVAVVPLLLTAMFYYAGCKLKSVLKTTATSFHIIASALLPIDLVMMKHLFPNTFMWNWDRHLFAVGLISTLVYALMLFAIRSRVLTSLAGAGFLATSFFFMRGFTSLSPSSQGLWFSIVGFGYMLMARWIRRRGWEPLDTPLNVLAHTAMAVALGNSMIGGPLAHAGGLGGASCTILAVSLAYVLAAYLLDEARYLPIFAVVLFGFVVFALRSHGMGIGRWYLYGFSFGVVGSAFLAMAPISRAQDKDRFAAWYQWFGLSVTAIAIIPALVRGLVQAATLQTLPSGPELLPSILTCLMISVSYAACSVWMKKPRLIYGAAVVFIYSAVLTIKLASRPTYEYTVWMMLLAAIMAVSGWYLTRRYKEHGSAVFNTGIGLSALSGAISIGMWAYQSISFEHINPGYCEAAILVMFISTALYAFAARTTRRVAYISAAIVSGVLGWGTAFSWLDDRILVSVLGREVNFGLYYLPLVVSLVWMRRVFQRRGNAEFAVPCDVFSFLLSIGVLALQTRYLAEPGAMRHSLWVTLALYSAIFAWQSLDRKRENLLGTGLSSASVYAYLSIAAFCGAAFHVLDGVGLYHRIGFVVISVLLLIAAWVLFRKREKILAKAPFIVGLAILSIDILVSISMWLDSPSASDRLVAFIVTATAAVACATTSAVLRNWRYLCPAMLTLSIAYGLAGAQWVMPQIPAIHVNYGIWYWPLVMMLAVCGHILHKKQQSSFAWVLHSTAAVLAVISLCLQSNYSILSAFIAFFAYGLLLAWVSMAARTWAEEKIANTLSQGSAYFMAALLGIGWLLLFEWIGDITSNHTLYRTIAALTGVAWCLISFRISVWMSSRDWEWWARPLFWSGVVAGVAWTVWPVVCGQSVFPLSLATCTLAAIFYTWIASNHGDKSFAYVGMGVFAAGYMQVFLAQGGLYAAPAQLALFSLAPIVLALCVGYMSALFRSRELAYVTTVVAEGSCFLLLRAGVEATKVHDLGWYGLGIVVVGFTAFLVSRILAKGDLKDLAIAPAHGSDLATTIAAIVACDVAVSTSAHNNWIIIATLAICAATYALSACLRKHPKFLYAACVAVIIGWGMAIDRMPTDFAQDNYVLLYLPLVVILGALAYGIRSRDRIGLSKPLWRSAMTLSVGCFLLQLAFNIMSPHELRGVATFMIFSALYATASYIDRKINARAEMLTYFSCASFVIGMNILPLPPYMLAHVDPVIALAHSVLGALWVGATVYLQSRSRTTWTRPLLISAGVVEAIAVMIAISAPLRNIGCAVATIVIAASVFTWIANRTGKRALIYVAGCTALVGLDLIDTAPGKWAALLSVLIPAIGAGLLAQATRAKEYALWFPILLWTGFIAYIVHSPSPLSPTPAFCVAFIIIMGISAVLFHRLAKIHDLPAFETLGALAGLVAYWCVPALMHRVISIDPVEHIAITLLPYAMFLAWLTWRLRSSDEKPLYRSYGAVALALSIVGAAAGVASGESLMTRTVTLALYTLAYLVTTAKFGSTSLVYITNASALVTWFMLYLALELPSIPDGLPCLGAWFGLFGVIQVTLGAAFNRVKKCSQTADIQCTIGATLCSVSALAALFGTLSTRMFGEWTIAVLLISTVANSTVAMVRRQLSLLHVGFAGVLISLYLIFYDKLDLRVLDIYALPIGIYLLALPAISRYVGRQVRPGPYYSTGLAIMLGSGLVTLAQTGWSSWNSYVLLGESVIAFLYGVSRHVKVFLFFGTGFSAVWAAALIRDSVVRQMHGSTLVAGILGIIIGTALIVFASRSEQKRAEILESIRQAARSFKEWD
ncbi:MAG: tetratricopeptide repeat protein [Armatimonadota bacterium]|nr:tetratricopeptide repeat protein [bacterium]